MDSNTLLKCVNCGFENSAFNVTIVGSNHGAPIYEAQCPLCESKKVKLIEGHEESELAIYITNGDKLRISKEV